MRLLSSCRTTRSPNVFYCFFLFFVATYEFLGVTSFLLTPRTAASWSPLPAVLQRSPWRILHQSGLYFAAKNDNDHEQVVVVAQTTRPKEEQQQDQNDDDDDKDEPPYSSSSETTSMSLDDVLKKARRKKLVIPMAMLQAFGDAPLWVVGTSTPIATTFTRYDGLLVALALALHATGFALGLVFGKLTAAPLRRLIKPSVTVQMLLLPSWPLLWAIGLDQVL
jgi:hypothetical protein